MKLFRGAILGAPASGKGTISQRIVKKYDLVHISTGDIFRQNISKQTPLGKSVQKYMSEGKLVPDILVMKIVMEQLHNVEDKSWLCDGFPRTIVQAEKLFMTYPISLVINLKVPFDVIIDRVKNRWVHVPSGRVYNTFFQPPKVPGKDDITGEPLSQRADDQPEAVSARLKVYDEITKPLLDFYRKQGVLKEFEGETTEEIWPSIDQILLKFMKPKS